MQVIGTFLQVPIDYFYIIKQCPPPPIDFFMKNAVEYQTYLRNIDSFQIPRILKKTCEKLLVISTSFQISIFL